MNVLEKGIQRDSVAMENKMVVFVRDEETKVLKSASFPIDELEVT